MVPTSHSKATRHLTLQVNLGPAAGISLVSLVSDSVEGVLRFLYTTERTRSLAATASTKG